MTNKYLIEWTMSHRGKNIKREWITKINLKEKAPFILHVIKFLHKYFKKSTTLIFKIFFSEHKIWTLKCFNWSNMKYILKSISITYFKDRNLEPLKHNNTIRKHYDHLQCLDHGLPHIHNRSCLSWRHFCPAGAVFQCKAILYVTACVFRP